MLKDALYAIVGIIARFHTQILRLNNEYALQLTDKQLHFVVIGILGMLIFFVVHPVFHTLARQGRTVVISWLYSFTLIIVLTFAIEIGQHITRTGNMEFADIVFGVVGFLVMFGAFVIIRGMLTGLGWLLRNSIGRKKEA